MWFRGSEEGEGAGGGIEVKLGADDGVGGLQAVEGGEEEGGVDGLGEEEGEDGDAGADGYGLAPAVLGAADRPHLGLR